MILSDGLINKIKNEATEEQIKEIYSSFHKYNIIVYYYKYITDSKFRRAVWLHEWLKEQVGNPIIEQVASECISDTYDKTIKNILRYWYNKLDYEYDINLFDKTEYWADVEETILLGKADCENFASIIYLTALAAGVPEYRMYFTIGWVNLNGTKTGHAYITYIADNLVMWAIDGTFYPFESMRFECPYFDNPKYYFGEKEWARFNTKGTYKIR